MKAGTVRLFGSVVVLSLVLSLVPSGGVGSAGAFDASARTGAPGAPGPPLEQVSAPSENGVAESHLGAFTMPATRTVGIAAEMTGAVPSEESAIPSPDATTRAAALGSTPLMFIENVGQFAEGARFQVRGVDRTIWLTEDGIWVTVVEPRPAPRPPHGAFPSPRFAEGWQQGPGDQDELRAVAIRLSFVGANPHPTLEPFGRLETSVNYFIGNEPADWQTNVPVWSGVRYRDLYPGVDLVIGADLALAYSGPLQRASLPWRLEVPEGADLSGVSLRIEGADVIALTSSRDTGAGWGEGLNLSTTVADLTLPLLPVNGAGATEHPRPRLTNNLVRSPFAPTSFQPAQSALLLSQSASDLLYATFLGGSDTDRSYDIAVHGSGSAYVTGETRSSDFPTTPGAFDTTHNSEYDVFVAKLSPDGSDLAYATFLGGSERDQGHGIAVDSTGNAYVTGATRSSDFPTTPGAYDTTYNGDSDAFVAKLSPDGTALAHATVLGGGEQDYQDIARAIALDGEGNVYVAGDTFSKDFPTTTGAYDETHDGGQVGFVSTLDPTLSTLRYSTFLGSWGGDVIEAIALDGEDNVYVTGYTLSTGFPTTIGAYDRTHNGDRDAFVSVLGPTLSTLRYSTFLGGSDWDVGVGIAVDEGGYAYVTGETKSSDFPTTPGAFDTTHSSGYDVFVAKLSPDGGTLAYATFLGGSDYELGRGIAVDESDQPYVTGYTYSSDFPTTPGAYDTTHNGGADTFVAKLSPDGSALLYSTFLGGISLDVGYGIAVDGGGYACVMGLTSSVDFPTTTGAYDTTYSGGAVVVFVAKLAMGGGSVADPNESTISVEPPSLPADGQSTGTVTVQLLSADGAPVSGKTVRLYSARGGADELIQPASPTDHNGEAVGLVRSLTPGTAHISVFDVTDGVELTHRGTVEFTASGEPPSAELLRAIDHLESMSGENLERLTAIASSAGEHGDYFRGAIPVAKAKIALGAAFGIIGAVDVYQEMTQPAVQLALPGTEPGWSSILNFKETYPDAGKLFDTTWQQAIQTGQWDSLSRPVLEGGFKYYAARIRDTAVEKVGKELLFEALHQSAESLSGHGDKAALFADDVADLRQGLGDNKAILLSNGLPPMGSETQQAYVTDLKGRSAAAVVEHWAVAHHADMLGNLRTAHDTGAQYGPVRMFLLKFAGKAAGNALFDGMGTLLISGTDLYLDLRRHDAAVQGYGQAESVLKACPEAAGRIFLNAANGLNRIGRVEAAPATGSIGDVTHYRTGNWPFTRQAYSDVWITNTGDEITTFKVVAQYHYDTYLFPGLPWARMPLVTEQTIRLSSGQSAPVRVSYKDGAEGGSPDQGSSIGINVLANNQTGTFYVGHVATTWSPQWVAAASMEGDEAAGLTATSSTADQLGPIDNPIDSYVLSDPHTQGYEAQLWAANPFTQSITAAVTQTFPSGVTVLDSGEAAATGDILTWQTVISPGTTVPLTYTFRYPAQPGSALTLPAAAMGFFEPVVGNYLVTISNEPTFYAHWPVLVEGYAPEAAPGVGATMPVTVTNLLTESVSGSLTLAITGTVGTVYSETQPFDIAAAVSDTVVFNLPSTLANGMYPLEGTVSVDGAHQRVLWDQYRVGAIGPSLKLQSDPAGPLYPGQLITCTVSVSNTTGLNLTGGVLTTTLPVGTSLVTETVEDGGVFTDTALRWDLGNLPDESEFTATYQVEVAGHDLGRDEVLPIESQPLFASHQTMRTRGPGAVNTVAHYWADFDCNCHVDIADIQTVAARWRCEHGDACYDLLYDVDGDGRITVLDIMQVAAEWGWSCP